MVKSKNKSNKNKKKDKQPKQETVTLSIKERLAQKRKATQARQELTNLLTKSISVALVLGIILGIVGGIKVAIPAILSVIVISVSYRYPREALYAFLIYVPLGGTITYYIGNSPVLQLAKDAFYVPALIALWQTCRRQRLPMIIPQGIKIPLFILLGLCLITLIFVNGSQQFNPPNVGLLKPTEKEIPLGMGILGLKVFLGYVPLIGCAYYLIRNQRDFLFLSRLQVVLTLTCCLLGILQYLLLLTGICEGTRNAAGDALFKASINARCYFGGALIYSPQEGIIRLPGTFVAPWQWAWYLIASTFFTFGTGFSDPSFIWRLIGLGSIASVFVNAVISGQRIALALVPICFVILLFLTGQIANLKRFIPVGIGLALILGIAVITNPDVVQERTESFSGRWEASPPQEFIVQQFQQEWKSVNSPFGNGLGRATNSARAMGPTRLIETYYPKVLYEVGILGLLGFIVLVTSLTVICFRKYRSIKNRNFRSYAAALWVFILFISYNTYYYPLDVDPVAVYYWFFAGVLLKLPELDKLERLQEKQAEKLQGKQRKKVLN